MNWLLLVWYLPVSQLLLAMFVVDLNATGTFDKEKK